MLSRLFLRWLGVLLLSCSMAPAALAALVVTDSGYNAGSTVFNQNGPGTVDQVVGWTFTVGQNDLRVTALGEWDYNAARGLGGGLVSSILVGLWDNSDGSLLASLFVPAGAAGTTLIDDFRFVDLATPVLLKSGHGYTIGDRRFPFGGTQTQFDLQGVGNTPTGSTDVIFGKNVNTPTGFDINVTPLAAQRPTQNIGGNAFRWIGPNIEYTVVPTQDVPEPGSLALALLGFALLASSRGYTRTAMRLRAHLDDFLAPGQAATRGLP
ncbi:PEP-CTERM sorting domain-containing protein [Ideonella sp. A 288]|uniref:PEP-CTERM sorting domain-containing protein n=1 Tax=Ideonella sp. A 288 TaxID=1962181 RepID=UPI001186818B|nr:PEP-CTERM sorting domain-containing protein [Ideonella sp. A 288]